MVRGESAEALVVKDLSVHYGSRRVLDAVDLTAAWGELVAVIGPNGAGKSTLFKALAGVVPFGGSVVLGGRECHHRVESAHIAYLPQQGDLDRSFPITVGQLVLTGRRPFLRPWRRVRPIDRVAVERALLEVGLSDRADSPVGSLSGGQLQRVLVARALAQEAEVLLLDEALAGVDTPTTHDLLHLFRRLTDAGRTILVATHDLALARQHFTRCIAINGRVVAEGPSHRVLASEVLDATFGSAALPSLADTGF